MNSHPTNRSTKPTVVPSDATPLQLGQKYDENQSGFAELHLLDPDHVLDETQIRGVRVDPSADDQQLHETHHRPVVGNFSNQPSSANGFTQSQGSRAGDGWLELRIWAEMFEDAMQQRIAANNRAERGGVDPTIYAAYTDALQKAENVCALEMRRCYRRVVPESIRTWQKNTHGLGEHAIARLLGHLGHPRIATPHHWEGTGSARTLIADEPFERTISQLWQYCGHGRPERKRKGMTAAELAAQGSPALKMIVHIIAECTMKQKASPYRVVYDDIKTKCADKTHSVECVRCGPSGKPAQPGTPWKPGHIHAHALRITGKEILRDLWLVAR
jgi:hypothetical protein